MPCSAGRGLAIFPLWTMIPSRSTSPAVSPGCRGWRRSPSAGLGPRGRSGRTATGTSRSTTEGASTRRRCGTSAGRARSPRSAAGAGAYSTAGRGWRSTAASPTFTIATWISSTAKSPPRGRADSTSTRLMFHLAGVPLLSGAGGIGGQARSARPTAPARLPGRAAGTGAGDLVGPGRADVRLRSARTTLRTVVSPSAPGSLRRRRHRRRTRSPGRARRVDHQREAAAHPAGLRSVDDLLAVAGPDPAVLRDIV